MAGASPGSHRRKTYETLSVDEAQARILSSIAPLPPASVSLDDALGLTLAEDIIATHDLPPFSNSAMDGFALVASSTSGATPASPVLLQLVGSIMAGHNPGIVVKSGVAARIMTGAPIPAGADAVVRIEDTEGFEDDRHGPMLELKRRVHPGDNVRPAGEDTRIGDEVLRQGTHIRPWTVGLLAGLGRDRVVVHSRPRIGILVTGDEITEPGQEPGSGQIWNSNGPMIAALIRQCGGEPVVLGPAADDHDAVRRCLAAASADLVVTTGGISIGDRDVLRDVLLSDPGMALWNIRIKPGKPLAFGQRDGTPLIGLPGNPVAAAVSFAQLVRPAIQVMLGRQERFLPEIQAVALDPFENRRGRRQFVRVHVTQADTGYTARSAGGQGSAMMTSLAAANGLMVIPESCERVEPGMVMTVQMVDWDQGT